MRVEAAILGLRVPQILNCFDEDSELLSAISMPGLEHLFHTFLAESPVVVPEDPVVVPEDPVVVPEDPYGPIKTYPAGMR